MTKWLSELDSDVIQMVPQSDSEFNITITNRPKTSKKCGQHAKSYEQFQHCKYKKVLKRMPKMKKTKEQR